MIDYNKTLSKGGGAIKNAKSTFTANIPKEKEDIIIIITFIAFIAHFNFKNYDKIAQHSNKTKTKVMLNALYILKLNRLLHFHPNK